jgi:glycine/serine hydroxymethyltransferase
MGEEEMKEIAKCIALTARDFAGTTDEVKAIVKVLCEKFPLYA